MMRSSFRYPSHSLAEMTQGHDPKGAPRSERPPLDDNAGASLYSTLADYAGFLSGVIDGGAGLPKQWRETMMVPQTMIDAETAWGLGWGLKQIRDERIFWQWGDNTGFKHIAAGSLEQARAVCVLTNGERGYEVWRRVLHLTLDPDGAIFEWASRL
jgi:CubicO group peptidase (beta-lactamase class C family)